jgi:heme A synthase
MILKHISQMQIRNYTHIAIEERSTKEMKKWIAAGFAVAGLAIFGGTAVAQQDGDGQPNAQQPNAQQQEQQPSGDGRDGDCPRKDGSGGQQESSPETEV